MHGAVYWGKPNRGGTASRRVHALCMRQVMRIRQVNTAQTHMHCHGWNIARPPAPGKSSLRCGAWRVPWRPCCDIDLSGARWRRLSRAGAGTTAGSGTELDTVGCWSACRAPVARPPLVACRFSRPRPACLFGPRAPYNITQSSLAHAHNLAHSSLPSPHLDLPHTCQEAPGSTQRLAPSHLCNCNTVL